MFATGTADYQKLECNRVILEEAEFSLGDLLQDAFLVARFKVWMNGCALSLQFAPSVVSQSKRSYSHGCSAVQLEPLGGRK